MLHIRKERSVQWHSYSVSHSLIFSFPCSAKRKPGKPAFLKSASLISQIKDTGRCTPWLSNPCTLLIPFKMELFIGIRKSKNIKSNPELKIKVCLKAWKFLCSLGLNQNTSIWGFVQNACIGHTTKRSG